MFKIKLVSRHQSAVKICLALLLVFATAMSLSARPQTPNDPERDRALKLYEASNYVEAASLLEKLAAKYPTDVVILSTLGFSLYANSALIKDPAARQQMREHARRVLLKSQELGDDSNLTQSTLHALSSSDPTDVPFSKIREAEKSIREGEEAFVRGDLDNALKSYAHAFELDPKLYEAALYAGDMYFKKGHIESDPRKKDELMTKAIEWFAKAVAVNADRETGHRYWGDALMMGQNKREESRAKFVEAVVAEPYNRSAWIGLMQWGQNYKVRLTHPLVEVPKTVSDSDPMWKLYAKTRAEWRSKLFAEAHPKEGGYRHSLDEESAALRAVAEAASKEAWSGKQLTPTLENVIELNKAGLLEAYVLFALADDGIARDYDAYRKANRDKLRRYLLEHVSSDKQ
jgi:tetratricopeptide (TPR) repeat protein